MIKFVLKITEDEKGGGINFKVNKINKMESVNERAFAAVVAAGIDGIYKQLDRMMEEKQRKASGIIVPNGFKREPIK